MKYAGIEFMLGEIPMRSYVTSAFLVAALVLAPAFAGYAPASSQDFSITNKVEPGSEWTRKLQAWWDVHAYYPPDSVAKKEEGTVKIHMVIHPDGEVFMIDVVQGSGLKSIDSAGFYVFHGAHLRPFPSGAPAPQSDVNLTLHYVLAHQQSKRPFTITNDPVHGTVVETMLQKTCTGTVVPIWWSHYPHVLVRVTFFRQPDATNWIKVLYNGKGPISVPVGELGKSATWATPEEHLGSKGEGIYNTHYWIWPVDDNHIGGTTADPPGTIDLTCE